MQLRIAELREKTEETRLQGQLDALQNERQHVIMLACKELITQDDLSYELAEIDMCVLAPGAS